MSYSSSHGSNQTSLTKSLPASVVSGVMGLVVGGGLTFLGLQFFGYLAEQTPPVTVTVALDPPQAPGGMMSGGMMGGGMMGGGMMGGGGNVPRGKRNLTTLVSKLDLASKGISFPLNQQQSSALAEELAQLEQPETMTQDEAQERFDALEAILNDGQKETLASFEMPRGGRGGGGSAGGGPAGRGPAGGGPAGGGPAAGEPAGGGPAAGGAPAGPGGQPTGAAADDGNPFQEEANQARLHSLLERLHATGEQEAAN